MNLADQILKWQTCPWTAKLTCSMDTDHPVLELRTARGRFFLQCPEETCGFIRYDIHSQVLKMEHGERHHGCHYIT